MALRAKFYGIWGIKGGCYFCCCFYSFIFVFIYLLLFVFIHLFFILTRVCLFDASSSNPDLGEKRP